MQSSSALEYTGDDFSSSRDGSLAAMLGIGPSEAEAGGTEDKGGRAFGPRRLSISGCPLTRASQACESVINGVCSSTALDACMPMLSMLVSMQGRANALVVLLSALLLLRGRSLDPAAVGAVDPNSAEWAALAQTREFICAGARVAVYYTLLQTLARSAVVCFASPARPATATAAAAATPAARQSALVLAIAQVASFGVLLSHYRSLPSIDAISSAGAPSAPAVPLSVSAHLVWCLRFASALMLLHTLAFAALLGMTVALLARGQVLKGLCDDINERLLPSAGALLSRTCTRLCGGVTREDAIHATPKSNCSFAATSGASSRSRALPSNAASASAASSSAAAASSPATPAPPMSRVAMGAAGKMRILSGCVVATMQELALRLQPALERLIHAHHGISPAPPLQRTRPGRRPSCIESFLSPVIEAAGESARSPSPPIASSAPLDHSAQQQPSVSSEPSSSVASIPAAHSTSSAALPFDLSGASTYPSPASVLPVPAESDLPGAASSSSPVDSGDDGFVLVDADPADGDSSA